MYDLIKPPYSNYCLLFFLCCLFACEESVDLTLDAVASTVVVNSTFSPGHPFQVSLSKNKDVLSNEPTTFISNATVRVLDEQGLFLETLDLNKNGVFPYYSSANFEPIPGVAYQIAVEIPGFPIIHAIDKIPTPVLLKKLRVDTVLENREKNDPLYAITISAAFLDPEKETNYYHLQLFYQSIEDRTQPKEFLENQEKDFLPLTTMKPYEDSLFLIANFDQKGFLFNDASFNGERIQLKFSALLNKTEASAYPKIIGELRTVSKSYYQYYTSLSQQLESKDRPFVEPVSIFNNIENGLGIFAGFSQHRDSVTVVQ